MTRLGAPAADRPALFSWRSLRTTVRLYRGVGGWRQFVGGFKALWRTYQIATEAGLPRPALEAAWIRATMAATDDPARCWAMEIYSEVVAELRRRAGEEPAE